MDMLSLTFVITSVIGCGFLIWFKTKSGKKWLKDL